MCNNSQANWVEFPNRQNVATGHHFLSAEMDLDRLDDRRDFPHPTPDALVRVTASAEMGNVAHYRAAPP